MDIEIYDQVSILRIWSKVKLHYGVFVRVWLKGAENSFEHRENWRVHLSRIEIWLACLSLK